MHGPYVPPECEPDEGFENWLDRTMSVMQGAMNSLHDSGLWEMVIVK